MFARPRRIYNGEAFLKMLDSAKQPGPCEPQVQLGKLNLPKLRKPCVKPRPCRTCITARLKSSSLPRLRYSMADQHRISLK